MQKKYDFKIEQILEMISIYQTRVPTTTIARLFEINSISLWMILKKYEKLNFMKFRSRSETLLTTLSKKRTFPAGEKNNRVKVWKAQFGREGLIDILTTILLTDGSADYGYGMVRLASSDQTLREIFTDLLNELSLNPRETKDSRNTIKIIFSRNEKVRTVLDEVYTRTPTTKHQPQRGTENWEIYSKQKQPSLSFLFNRPKELIELCFRIGLSLDGCVTESNARGKKRPALYLVCFHPTLVKEWMKISEMIGLNMKLNGNRIRTRSVNLAEKFLKMGGFIEGVKICSKSKNFEGTEKNQRLKYLLEHYYNSK